MHRFEKWRISSKAEKEFWSQKERAKGKNHWQDFLKKKFRIDFGFFTGRSTLDVGCGPFGIVHFIDSLHCVSKIGIDPLIFSDWAKFEKTTHIIAVGEYLPFRDQSIDVVTCFNVLDHVFSPEKVVSEIARVIRKDGKLLLWVHTLKPFIRRIKSILDMFDRTHPHHFYPQEVITLLREKDLRLIMVRNKRIKDESIAGTFVRYLVKDDLKVALGSLLINDMFMILKK